MAYIRWGTKVRSEINCSKGKVVFRCPYLEGLMEESNWYIYWDVCSGDTKDTQMLAIWYVGDERTPIFPYKKLKDTKTPQQLKELLKLDEVGLNPDDVEYEVALRAINAWKEDVDKEFRKEGI